MQPTQFTYHHAHLSVTVCGEGFPILCLHGHPGSGASMSVFTKHLSQRFKTIAPDLRGYGLSRARGGFQMTDHLSDLEALLDSLQIQQCIVLGWSLGGILALELAIRQPERVRGLILIATAARPRSSHPPVSRLDLFYTGLSSILNRIRPGWGWNIETFGKRSLYRYLIAQHTPVAYNYLAFEGMSAYLKTTRTASRALAAALKTGYDRRADLASIQCPCLVLAGADDRHITAESSIETARGLKDCQWRCYPNTAHLFPWEIPDLVLTDIDQWINLHFDPPAPLKKGEF